MVSASYICLLSIHVYWSLTISSDNFREIKVQHMRENVLGLSCHFTNTENSWLVTVSIFEDTPNNTLVTLSSGYCPIIKSSARAKQIYLPQCVQKEEIHSLDILLLNYSRADSQRLGCNYTFAEGKLIRHSLSFVYTSDPAKVISFSISPQYSSTSSINRGDVITFICAASGNPLSQLTLQQPDGSILNKSSSGSITHEKVATCSDTGKYVCVANNTINNQHYQDSKVEYLQVRCPPSCPTQFTLVSAGPNSVRLSWTPGFDGGLKQTFTVLRVDIPRDTASSSPGVMELGTVEYQGGVTVYEVTGLSESTVYTFGLEAANEKGSGNCSHLQLTVSTSASSAVFSGGNVIIIIVVPVVAVVALLIFVVVVMAVVVIKRQRAYPHTKPVNAADISLSGTGETSRVANSNSLEDDYLYPLSPTTPENPDTNNPVPLYEEIDDGCLRMNSGNKSCCYQNVKCSKCLFKTSVLR